LQNSIRQRTWQTTFAIMHARCPQLPCGTAALVGLSGTMGLSPARSCFRARWIRTKSKQCIETEF
jgi:hypothetical protein